MSITIQLFQTSFRMATALFKKPGGNRAGGLFLARAARPRTVFVVSYDTASLVSYDTAIWACPVPCPVLRVPMMVCVPNCSCSKGSHPALDRYRAQYPMTDEELAQVAVEMEQCIARTYPTLAGRGNACRDGV
jgi:hypothetical protein